MFNHVQLYVHVHWMHLFNTRISRYTYVTPTLIYCDQTGMQMKLFDLERGLYYCKSGVFLTEQNRTELYYLSGCYNNK